MLREKMKKQLNETLAGLGLSVKPTYRPVEVEKILGISGDTFLELVNGYSPHPDTGSHTDPNTLDSFMMDHHRVTYYELVDYLIRNHPEEKADSIKKQGDLADFLPSKYQKYKRFQRVKFSKILNNTRMQLEGMLEIAGIEQKDAYRSGEVRKLLEINAGTFSRLVKNYEQDPEIGLLKDPLSLNSSKVGYYRRHWISHEVLVAFLLRNNTYQKAHSAYRNF